jgi:hypothetical protein
MAGIIFQIRKFAKVAARSRSPVLARPGARAAHDQNIADKKAKARRTSPGSDQNSDQTIADMGCS